MSTVLAGFIAAFAMASQPVGCIEKAGLGAIDKNHLAEARELLKGCEHTEASGKDLHNLNILVFPKGFGSYDSMETRIFQSEKLSCRAALKGYTISIRKLANLYKYYDEYLQLEPNHMVSLCLSNIPSLNSSEYVDPKDFEHCLSLNPDIDPINQCY